MKISGLIAAASVLMISAESGIMKLSAQSIFTTNANATNLGNAYYQITANVSHKKGTAWNNTKVDLSKPFDLSFLFYFGTVDTGADGMSFTIQNSSAGLTAFGDDGRNMGYSYANGNPLAPALNVEFDTYDNGTSYGDIPEDHLAIYRDGNQTSPLAAPIFVVNNGANIEDGVWHLVEFTWNPFTTTFEIYFDCDLRQTLVYDVLNLIFGGNPYAYVGITGGTGLLKNSQQFRELYHDAGSDTTVCSGTSFALNSRSDLDSLQWTPSTGLSCDTCESPVVSAQATTTYYFSGKMNCKSFLDSVTITVLPVSSLLKNATICQGQSYFCGGGFQTQSGSYVDHYTNQFGCDSMVTTNLIVNPNSSFTSNVSICQGQSYFCGGALQTQSGSYVDHYSNYFGCDSMVTTNLTVNPNSSVTNNVSICQGQSYFCGGAFQTQSGSYTDHYSNNFGCDSMVTTNLSVLPSLSSSQNISICQGQSFFCGGTFQTQNGVYYDSLTSVFGCDSILTTNLSVLPNSSSSVNISICQGQSYFCGGAFQTMSGIYVDHFSNSLGCDSALTTDLTVIPNSSSMQNISICQGQSFYCGGANQTQSGIYFDTLLNSLGCDSLLTTNLSVLSNSTFTQNLSICSGDSIFLGGGYQTISGTYLDHFSNSLGCDSTVTTNLSVLPMVATHISVSVCEGQSFFCGGALQSQSGIYVDSLTAISGCDSILTTNLSVLPATSTDIYPAICPGEKYFAAGTWQTTPGIYTDTLSSSIGCDSTVITHLTVNLSPSVNLGNDTTFCEGAFVTLNAGSGFQSYLWQDNSVLQFFTASDAGSFWVRVTNSFGCTGSDTMEVKDVYPLPSDFLPHDTLICGNIPLTIDVHGFKNYQWYNGDSSSSSTFNEEGTYWLQVTDAHGCSNVDSVHIKNGCDEDFLMPNAFTPNGDGLNDVFMPVIVRQMSAYDFKIFNRWGIMIFETSDPATGWDGFDNGVKGEMGVYAWALDYVLESGARESARGDVTLIR